MYRSRDFNHTSDFPWSILGILTIFLCAILFQCSGPVFGVDRIGATRILTQQGYSQVEITGYRWFVGSESDYFHTGFKAVSPAGIHVSGTVTKGIIFKSATIRFD
jgi:hypothetical protein